MSVKPLPNWVVTNMFPAVHDTESLTVIEQTARLYAKIQEIIEDYNLFVKKVDSTIEDFKNSTNEDIEVFKTAIRQEFQDFIDTVELKLKAQDKEIAEAISYMKTNISSVTQKVVQNAIAIGEISIVEEYNENTETLNLVVTGDN